MITILTKSDLNLDNQSISINDVDHTKFNSITMETISISNLVVYQDGYLIKVLKTRYAISREILPLIDLIFLIERTLEV